MASYYIDYNRGNDLSAGTSRATAWQNLSKLASQTLSSGDTVYLANDSHWVMTSRVLLATIAGTESSPCIITWYDSGGGSSARPRITYNFDVTAAEWTYEASSNGWYKDIGLPPGRMARILLSGRTFAQYQFTFTAGSVPLQTMDGAYSVSSNRLYLYAPSTTDPTTYYGSVNVGPSDRGAFGLSNNGAYLIFDGIDFRAMGTGIVAFANTGTRHLIVRNCSMYDGGPLLFINTATAGSYTFSFENNAGGKAVSAVMHAQDAGGLGMGPWVARNNRISGCNFGYPQGAFYLQVRGAPGLVEGNYIDNAKYGTPLQLNDGCAIYTEAGGSNIMVRGNFIENSLCALQDNTGRTASFVGNVIKNCKTAIKVTDESNLSATVHTFHNNLIINGGKYIAPQGPNTTSGNGWWAYETTTPAMTISIRNNVFLADPTNSAPGAAIETPASALGTISHNCYFGYSTLAENYLGGAASPTPSNTINTNPLVNDVFIAEAAALLNAGANLGGLDYYGKDFSSTPNIGAAEDFPARTVTTRTAVTRSVASRDVADKRAIAGA